MSALVKTDMQLLVVALYDEAFIDDVILGLTSVSGAQVTVIDAVTGSQNLSGYIPMFAEIIGVTTRRYCKILLTCVKDDSPAARFVEALQEAGIDFSGDSLGEVYAIPLSGAIVLND